MGRARWGTRTEWLIPAVVLAIAVGAVVALFGPLDALVLQPLPFPRPRELVRVSRVRIFDPAEASIAHRGALSGVFQGVAGYWNSTTSWLDGGAAVGSVVVTGEFFSTLGVHLREGTGFDSGAAPGLPQAVVGYRLWRWQKEARVGSRLRVDGRSYRIVGVAPQGFAFPAGDQVWEQAAPGAAEPDVLAGDWVIFGRLHAGVSLGAAQAQLEMLTKSFRGAVPAGRSAETLEPLQSFLRGDRRDLLWCAWAAACGLLLVACGGATSMALARGARRRRDYAVRLALGSSPARLVGDEVRTNLGPALCACGIGLLLAHGITVWLQTRGLWGDSVAAARGKPPTLAVAAGAMVLVLATTAIGAAIPVWQVGAGGPSRWLAVGPKRRASGATPMGSHDWLTGAQLGIALVLVAGAVLLISPTLARLRQPLGFQAGKLIVVQTSMPPVAEQVAFQHALRASGRYTTALSARLLAADRAELARDVPLAHAARRTLAALPGVADVGVLYPTPFGASPFTPQQVSAIPMSAARFQDLVTVAKQDVSGNAFRLLGVPLLAGRTFGRQDQRLIETVEGLPVVAPGSDAAPLPAVPVVINRTLAQRLWPGKSSLGKRIWTPEPGVVIGVVADMRESPAQAEDAPMVFQLAPPATFHFLVQPKPGARFSVLAAEAARAVQQLSPEMAPPFVSRVAGQVAQASRKARLLLWLLGSFAVVGSVAAALGVYGGAQEAMAAREQEFAVRAALGAPARHLYGLAARRVARLLAIALPAAALGSWLLTRGLAHVVGGSTVAALAAFVIAAVALAALTALVYLRFAQRAVHASPAESMRG